MPPGRRPGEPGARCLGRRVVETPHRSAASTGLSCGRRAGHCRGASGIRNEARRLRRSHARESTKQQAGAVAITRIDNRNQSVMGCCSKPSRRDGAERAVLNERRRDGNRGKGFDVWGQRAPAASSCDVAANEVRRVSRKAWVIHRPMASNQGGRGTTTKCEGVIRERFLECPDVGNEIFGPCLRLASLSPLDLHEIPEVQRFFRPHKHLPPVARVRRLLPNRPGSPLRTGRIERKS